MANDTGGDRTEEATPRRRQEARKKGQVARSAELNSVLVVGVGLFLSLALAGMAGQRIFGASNFFFGEAGVTELSEAAEAQRMILLAMREGAMAAGPLLIALLVVGTGSAIAQVGFSFSTEALGFRAEKLNPIEGIKNRFFSKMVLFELSKNVLKVALLGTVAALAVRDLLPQMVGLAALSVAAGWKAGAAILGKLILRMVCVLAALAVIDFWWQKQRHEEQLKMTKDEVRREHKDTEGDPHIKVRMRSMMLEKLRTRMMAEVPTADVVVTNPTHFSVALRYRAQDPAPRVVAKGQGQLALRIRRVAQENGVPVMENPPLARALYRAVEVGDTIPVDLYEAVAQVLAAVYRADKARSAAAGVN